MIVLISIINSLVQQKARVPIYLDDRFLWYNNDVLHCMKINEEKG